MTSMGDFRSKAQCTMWLSLLCLWVCLRRGEIQEQKVHMQCRVWWFLKHVWEVYAKKNQNKTKQIAWHTDSIKLISRSTQVGWRHKTNQGMPFGSTPETSTHTGSKERRQKSSKYTVDDHHLHGILKAGETTGKLRTTDKTISWKHLKIHW